LEVQVHAFFQQLGLDFELLFCDGRKPDRCQFLSNKLCGGFSCRLCRHRFDFGFADGHQWPNNNYQKSKGNKFKIIRVFRSIYWEEQLEQKLRVPVGEDEG
jgi:hypothetical protein